MKKLIKSIIIVIIIIVLLAMIFFIADYAKFRQGKETIFFHATAKAVVIKVDERSLVAMGIGDVTGLLIVGYTQEGNIGFKQGQEILIYYDGIVIETYPGQLGKVKKIKILKEKSDTEIPESYLKYCFSSSDNVKVTVNEFKTTGITLTITDTNELPYEYTGSYTIRKKVKNKDYTGIGYKLGEDTENSIAGFTRNRF